MHCELKNVSINARLSEETTCFTADLWIDGVKAASVSNRGTGGSNDYCFADRALEARFTAYCESLPPVQFSGDSLPMDADLFIGELLGDWEERRAMKRLCRKSTLFRLKDQTYGRGEWLSIKTPFSPAMRAKLVEQHGDNLAEIANEVVA